MLYGTTSLPPPMNVNVTPWLDDHVHEEEQKMQRQTMTEKKM
jgi:aspartate-semialdehyde dehydrogenase